MMVRTGGCKGIHSFDPHTARNSVSPVYVPADGSRGSIRGPFVVTTLLWVPGIFLFLVHSPRSLSESVQLSSELPGTTTRQLRGPTFPGLPSYEPMDCSFRAFSHLKLCTWLSRKS